MKWTDRLELQRARLGLTQDQMAERIGVTPGAYRHWLAGIRAPDSLDKFDAIALAAGCSPAWLVYGAFDPDQDSAICHVVEVMQERSEYEKGQIAQLIDAAVRIKSGTG